MFVLVYNRDKNKHSYEVISLKQLLLKYSKQELTMLGLFVLIVIWLFMIVSFDEPMIEETHIQEKEELSVDLVFHDGDEFK